MGRGNVGGRRKRRQPSVLRDGFHTHHFVRKVIYYLLKRSCNFLAWYTTSGKIISAAYALCICGRSSLDSYGTNDADRARFRSGYLWTQLQTGKRLLVWSFRDGSHGTVCMSRLWVVFNALNNGNLRSIIQLDKFARDSVVPWRFTFATLSNFCNRLRLRRFRRINGTTAANSRIEIFEEICTKRSVTIGYKPQSDWRILDIWRDR